MDSSVHGISQARILEWVAIAFYSNLKKKDVVKLFNGVKNVHQYHKTLKRKHILIHTQKKRYTQEENYKWY